MRLAWLLRDLPVELVGRLRSDRVLRLPKPPHVYAPEGGRPARHGKEFSLARPASWPEPSVVTVNDTPRYGKAKELPVIEGTLIRLDVDHLPGDHDAPPVWLWSSAIGVSADDIDFAYELVRDSGWDVPGRAVAGIRGGRCGRIRGRRW
ncbi:transposase, partial [Streptomyces sp. NPDC018045]|uniref:transposase n=1 Tax=Streptomyces sp. NPDC018045 TaxID=3365037 RepID=UPI00379DB312